MSNNDKDLMALPAFRKSHPIDFRLYDDDEQAVLYIGEDAAGHNMNLELRNTSPQAIQFANGSSAVASEANHHFALRFRPGTLSEGVLKLLVNPQERAKLLKQADQWDLYFPPKPPAANEAASLYLLYKGPSKTFQPNEARTLTLQRMSAAPGSGARGTQVEIIPRQLTAAGGDATPITGSRTQYVHITNQRGKKNIPLHVGFVDGNTVLNDGKTPNKLRLRITNVSKDGEIALNTKASSAPSKFILSFDAQKQGQTKEWALVTTGDSKNVKVSVDGREIKPEGIEGETPEWPITFDAALRLAAGKHLQIDIAGIVSSLPSGHANLYVRYENIPGYWDGQFVCTVEKGPIVSDKGNVGIGTASPNYLLDVKSNTPIKLGLEGRGGGQLLIANDANDNKIYLEAFSSDAKGHAAEFLLTGKDGGQVPKIDLRADTTHINGALQLNGGAIVKSILKDVASGGNYAESLPNVAMVVELIDKAIQKFAKEVPFNLCTVTIPNVYPDPSDPPRITITSSTVTYAGSFWVEAPEKPPQNTFPVPGLTDTLARLYPPLAAPLTGKAYIFGAPRTNLAMEGNFQVDFQVNQLGELRLNKDWMLWAIGMVKFRLSGLGSYKVRELKTSKR